MKTLLIISLLLLAGCAEPVPEADPKPQTPAPTENTGNEAMPLVATIVAPWSSTEDEIIIKILVNQEAHVAVISEGDMMKFNGQTASESVAVPIHPYGSLFEVFIDNGKEIISWNRTIAQLTEVTFEVQYGGYPGNQDHVDLYHMNLTGYASASAYKGRDTAHPGYPTVHDLMVEWENQFGEAIEYAYSDGLGYSVSKINGAGSPLTSSTPPYWLYDVNGESPDLGISAERIAPGDHVRWCLNTCS